ncbi:putative Hemin-binding periplasmic protein HmuT,putative [Salinisphaera sp. PC39]
MAHRPMRYPNRRNRTRWITSAWLLLAAFLAGPAAAETPARIVSVGGAVTEILFELGLGDRLVAVDSTSQHPPAARELPDVGYMRRLAAEPIVALDPDLVLAIEDSGPPAVLRQIREAGVRIVTVADDPSPAGVLAKVRAVAGAVDRPGAGQRLAERIAADFAAASERVAAYEDRPRVLFLMSAGNGPPLAAGRDTAAANIIELAGGRNAMTGFAEYRPITPEATVAAEPEVVLVGDRTLAALGGAAALRRHPAIAATPAGQAGRIVAMDMLLLLGFGPRTPQAVRELAAALHPDTAPADAP